MPESNEVRRIDARPGRVGARASATAGAVRSSLSTTHTVIVCDWLPPAFGAVGQYMMLRARDLAADGQSVAIVGLGDQFSTEHADLGAGELTVRRVRAVGLQKGASMISRAIWALRKNVKLMWSAHLAIRRTPRQTTDIVVTGSPPFLSYMFIVINRLLWNRTLIYRITDFYPETVFAAGYMNRFRWIAGLFHFVRRQASRIEALGEDQKRRLAESGVPPEMVEVVRDASPVASWNRPPKGRPFGEDKVVLLYSGNMGVAHETETILAAYERHVRHGSNRLRLWVNGTGARLGPFIDRCRELDLPLHVSGPVPIEDLPAVLKAADAHLVLLKTPFWGYVLPSKIYACLELAAPLLFVGPQESDVHLLGERRAHPYVRIEPGEVEACVSALEWIADDVIGRRGGKAALA